MLVRPIIAIVAAVLVATQVVRSAIVESFADSRPTVAAEIWKGHPATEISLGMSKIASAAREHRQVPASVLTMMADAASKEPLAPEPFLARGAQAELAGNDGLAQRAFEAAQWRDPRSRPAAYFLADRYFRTGNIGHGLREVAALARLSPNGPETLAPHLVEYARNPGNWPALGSLFRANPELADPALTALATNLSTAPAVLALADSHERAEDARWLPPLVNTLVAAGQYSKAHEIWARTARSAAGNSQAIYDSTFSDKTAVAPFNWTLASSAIGLAERAPGGRLHVIFYGEEDGILASELLLLRPATYRLSLQLFGDATRARMLTWSIWCDRSDAPIASSGLDKASRGWTFTVPSGCEAQWLKLSGSSRDRTQQVDVTIGNLKLDQVTPGA